MLPANSECAMNTGEYLTEKSYEIPKGRGITNQRVSQASIMGFNKRNDVASWGRECLRESVRMSVDSITLFLL